MAVELKRLAEECKKAGFSQQAELLRFLVKQWQKEGLPGSFDTEKKTDVFKTEWKKQANKYIELRFPEELGLSREDYLNSLPQFSPQPEAYKGRFGIPLLVETRIPPARQAELAGLRNFIVDEIRDWEGDPKGYRTSAVPYTTWMQDGRKYLGKSVEQARKMFAGDERGATVFDGIALFIIKPRVLDNHSIDLAGSSVGSVFAPYLHLWFEEPELRAPHVANAHSHFGSASCGR